MKYYCIFLVAIYVAMWSVSRALDEVEQAAFKDIDEHEREAWSSGFARGVKSASE